MVSVFLYLLLSLKKIFLSGAKGNAEDGKQFILKKYLACNPDPERQCYSHFTTATGLLRTHFCFLFQTFFLSDTENIKLVFCAVKDTILQAALKEFNLG